MNVRNLGFWGLLFSVGFLPGCGKLPGYEVLNKQDAFTATVEVNPNIDLLFVIDNSGSMARDQSVLASSFSGFINQFTTKGFQYNIAVTSTDTCPYDSTCNTNWWSPSGSHYPGINNQGSGTFLSKTSLFKFITWNLDPLDPVHSKALTISNFTANSSLGTLGSGAEAGLLATSTTLSSGKLAGYNTGFLRSDSFFSIIFVTDEDESYGFGGTDTGPPSSTYISTNTTHQTNRMNQYLAALTRVRGATLENFSMHVIAVPASATQCVINGVPELPGDFAPAVTFNRVVNYINDPNNYPQPGGGIQKATFDDICQDFSPALNNIASTIIQANARYKLVQVPADSSQITVTVNGAQVARNTANGWDYDAPGNYVQFYGTAIPNVGDQISIDYVPGAPI